MQQLAYREGELRHAINLGNQLYQNEPGFESALINALCHSLLGEVRPAIGWLNCAIQDGLPSPRRVLEKKEFDVLRNDALFQELLKKADSSQRLFNVISLNKKQFPSLQTRSARRLYNPRCLI